MILIDYDLGSAYTVAPTIAETGLSDSCSDDRLSAVAAIVGATDRRDSRPVYKLQATGRRDYHLL